MAVVRNPWLMAGAALSAVAALLHVGCIVFGAEWYRFFSAGEDMAMLAEAGDWRPALITSAIVVVLSIWALYALSGAGAVRKLPLLRLGLCVIAAVYSLRGLAGLLYAAFGPSVGADVGADAAFLWWSSAICLGIGIGIVHAIGLTQVWRRL